MFNIFNFFQRHVNRIVSAVSREKEDHVIALNDVHKNFNGKNVLDGVSLGVKRGETLAIIGPSGCGKSTVLRLIIGLFPPTSGQIIVNGKDLATLDKDQFTDLRKNIGMVFQSSALFDSLTVGENVAFGLREHSALPEQRIREIVSAKLKLVGLENIESLMPSELSGGMQKRVSLARALATDPEIILYDEPTTGLDPITATAIEDLILDIHAKLKTSSVIVTHQLSTVYRIADRIVMLHNGKIIEAGTPDDAKKSTSPIIQQFITGRVS